MPLSTGTRLGSYDIVAPNRSALISGSRASRMAALAPLGPWQPAQGQWRGDEPEWDVLADAVEGTRTLHGEARRCWWTREGSRSG